MDSKELMGLVEAYSEVYAPIDEGKSSRPRYSGPERVGLGPTGSERRTEKRAAHAEYRKGHTEGPGTVTKNPKKLRKQKAMGELGGSGKAEVEEQLDIFDVVLEFLQAEGYAETLEEAEWMMANELDSEDIANILESMHKDEDEEDEKKMKKGKKSKKEDDDDDDDDEELDEALTGERYKKAIKKPGARAYSRMVSADPAKRATRGGRGGESDFGAGDRGSGNRAKRRVGKSVDDSRYED